MVNLFKNIIKGVRGAFARFPVSMIYSISVGLILIFLIENENTISSESIENLAKIAMVLGMGILLFLALNLGFESHGTKKNGRIIGFVGAVIFQVLYYYVFLNEMNMVSVTRYVGTILLLIALVMFIPRLRRPEGLVSYVKGLTYAFSIAAVYAAVLFIGLVLIVFTIEQLFDIPFWDSIYIELFILVVFIFAASMFLSRIPGDKESDDGYYSSAVKILLEYIVIPLIFIYSAILYVYFIKIIATWDWPKGLVSHLVLWYSVLASGLIFISSPLLGKSRIVEFFNKWFPIINLPILLMMFLSMGLRIMQYGITENRYFVLALGIWVLFTMINYALTNRLGNISVLVAIAIIITISLYGPVSAYNVSIRSQNNRLDDLLQENGMISEGVLVSGGDVSLEDKREINNIIHYFQQNHSLDDVKSLPDNTEPDNLSGALGFDYEPYSRGDMSGRFNIYLVNMETEIIDVSEYDYYFRTSSWNQELMESGQIGSKFTKKDNLLELYLDDEVIFSESLSPLVKQILEEDENQPEISSSRDQNQMTFQMDNENTSVKIIFTSINGTYEPGAAPDIRSMEFMVLLRIE